MTAEHAGIARSIVSRQFCKERRDWCVSDRMSRNKDKHEGASGRQYRILSDAERAAGRRGGWTTLEVTGGVRALAPQLFQLAHLTELYLNDNSLQRIPPDISQLSNLHTLDVSNNKLRSLPAELGDLIQLRELHLNNNYLRVLPYELGKLFHLQLLGLQGNPLSKEMLSIYNDSNGTAKLLTYMLDNLQGKNSDLRSVRVSFTFPIFLVSEKEILRDPGIYDEDEVIWGSYPLEIPGKPSIRRGDLQDLIRLPAPLRKSTLETRRLSPHPRFCRNARSLGVAITVVISCGQLPVSPPTVLITNAINTIDPSDTP
ncbi:unnamed protein product, partial [Iphiclides podalirius]